MNFTNPHSSRWTEFPYSVPGKVSLDTAPQLTIYIGDTDTLFTGSFDLGTIAQCATGEQRFRLVNTGGQYLVIQEVEVGDGVEITESPAGAVLGAGESAYLTLSVANPDCPGSTPPMD